VLEADAVSIWIVQFVGREIRVLDYIEGVGLWKKLLPKK
jgi:hypothetical protein